MIREKEERERRIKEIEEMRKKVRGNNNKDKNGIRDACSNIDGAIWIRTKLRIYGGIWNRKNLWIIWSRTTLRIYGRLWNRIKLRKYGGIWNRTKLRIGRYKLHKVAQLGRGS